MYQEWIDRMTGRVVRVPLAALDQDPNLIFIHRVYYSDCDDFRHASMLAIRDMPIGPPGYEYLATVEEATGGGEKCDVHVFGREGAPSIEIID
jgi:hypothetical protein